jgi:hypothetical protein
LPGRRDGVDAGENQKRFAAEIAYIPVLGGRYNNIRDRDVMTMAVIARF